MARGWATLNAFKATAFGRPQTKWKEWNGMAPNGSLLIQAELAGFGAGFGRELLPWRNNWPDK